MPLKIFLHGLESSNQGTKSIFFRKEFPDMIIPNFTGDLEQRMAKLNIILSEESGIMLTGSSFGGLMATIYAMENEPRVKKLILLAPAVNMLEIFGYKKIEISVPVSIYMGIRDEVLPIQAVEIAAKRVFLNISFNVVDDDHFLHKTFSSIDWHSLLGE